MKKYEFTGETKTVALAGRTATLHRIRAIVCFKGVNSGDTGGWVECEKNLSHEGDAWVYGNAKVYDNAKVCGDARVYGNARVYGDAEVFQTDHILVAGPIGSRDAFTTFYKGADNKIYVSCGCFNGSIDEFINKVKQRHGSNRYAAAYNAAVELARLTVGLTL